MHKHRVWPPPRRLWYHPCFAAFRMSPFEDELDTHDCHVPCERPIILWIKYAAFTLFKLVLSHFIITNNSYAGNNTSVWVSCMWSDICICVNMRVCPLAAVTLMNHASVRSFWHACFSQEQTLLQEADLNHKRETHLASIIIQKSVAQASEQKQRKAKNRKK